MSERQMEQHLSSLAPAEAGESISRDPGPAATRADGTGERTDEPRVDGNALASSGSFDRELQALGKSQRDPGDQGILSRRGRWSFALLLHVDERRILPGEADLDVPQR